MTNDKMFYVNKMVNCIDVGTRIRVDDEMYIVDFDKNTLEVGLLCDDGGIYSDYCDDIHELRRVITCLIIGSDIKSFEIIIL